LNQQGSLLKLPCFFIKGVLLFYAKIFLVASFSFIVDIHFIAETSLPFLKSVKLKNLI